MFWNKKKISKEQIKSNADCGTIAYLPREFRRETKHTRSIVDGKLYDTEKSTVVSYTQDKRLLFITEKGNYFSCDVECDGYISPEEDLILEIHTTAYKNIRPETAEYAKENIGKYAPDKYIELFGEVEEA